jgi:hypothetical protein
VTAAQPIGATAAVTGTPGLSVTPPVTSSAASIAAQQMQAQQMMFGQGSN